MINLKILFKNKTKYTKQAYKEFVEIHNKTHNFTYTLYTVIVIALLLICLVLQVNNHTYSLAITFCLIITCFILWRFFHPVSVVSKQFNSSTIQTEKEFTFNFYNKYFKIIDNNQFEIFKYYKIYKVYETDNFFYLYTNRTHSFLINKNNFLVQVHLLILLCIFT